MCGSRFGIVDGGPLSRHLLMEMGVCGCVSVLHSRVVPSGSGGAPSELRLANHAVIWGSRFCCLLEHAWSGPGLSSWRFVLFPEFSWWGFANMGQDFPVFFRVATSLGEAAIPDSFPAKQAESWGSQWCSSRGHTMSVGSCLLRSGLSLFVLPERRREILKSSAGKVTQSDRSGFLLMVMPWCGHVMASRFRGALSGESPAKQAGIRDSQL